jgi:hypothetical protein
MEGNKWKAYFAKMKKGERDTLARHLSTVIDLLDEPEMEKIKDEFSLWGLKTLDMFLHEVDAEQPSKPIARINEEAGE